MERYVLVVSWQRRTEGARDRLQALPAGLSDVQDTYSQLKDYCLSHTDTFPACSLSGDPGVRKWFFALQLAYGSFQFSSCDWEDLSLVTSPDDGSEPPPCAIDECVCALQSSEEDDEDSRDSVSQTSLYEECADSLHQLADKLPAPGKALVDILLISPDVPKLKECLLALGAMKHLREWHAAKITIVSRENKGWHKILNYLSASIVVPECLKNSVDPQELWRGSTEIYERKLSSEVEFPDFCLRSTCDDDIQSRFQRRVLNNNNDNSLPEVFHYYGSSLQFVQMVELSELPHYFISNHVFTLCLTRNSLQGKSKLMLDQLCSLNAKVGAVFLLPCNVCSLPLPPESQRSSKKWKEYLSRKPKEIKVPGIKLKGEYCNYYFLVQGLKNGVCKATMIHSSNQINGAASINLLHQRLNDRPETDNPDSSALSNLPLYDGDQILMREKTLARARVLVVEEFFRRKDGGQPLTPANINSLKALLKLTRDRVFSMYESKLPKDIVQQDVKQNRSGALSAESQASMLNSSEWPERNVLQNLENFEKIQQRIRASMLSSSAEHLLGRKDSQKEGLTPLDAKELLKYFTPQGLAIGELQPLQVQRGDNVFLLTPQLTPRKLSGLPFERASECHYHGLEYCLDERKALDRDVAYSELQSRLIRYETQTTCTRECCPLPFALSPLPSPAVLSEPGSVPDGESLQDHLRLKRRSRDLDGLIASKRLAKSESSDSLLSLASEGSGPRQPSRVTRTRSERMAPAPSSAAQTSSSAARGPLGSSKPAQPKQPANLESESKESRSQKHSRMLREVVCKTLQKHAIQEGHPCFAACSQRLFEVSKFFLKDLKTSRGLNDEMKKAAANNVKQVIQWELDKLKK
ncbi:PREDICTED: mdm2-binding protein [Nanorana parkeri]|uniref:mdm2-binding protein n=1 Tax=Nanorana parkeri TaxID=125878 RepID=UPI0008545377|nr:PREDICTED: mdm2-binding protein [Nanorana parkeri]